MSARSRGANFERRVRAQLEANGWLVVRAAGSRGCFDLVALRSDGHRHSEGRLIQCKTRRRDFTPAERAALREASRSVNATSVFVARGSRANRYALVMEIL